MDGIVIIYFNLDKGIIKHIARINCLCILDQLYDLVPSAFPFIHNDSPKLTTGIVIKNYVKIKNKKNKNIIIHEYMFKLHG